MKVWIDRLHGLHYHSLANHKENCKLVDKLSYVEITIGNKVAERGLNIYPWGKTYIPCPFCFGHREIRRTNNVV